MPPHSSASPFGIRRILLQQDVVVLEAEATAATATCPSCGAVSEHIHDRYQRHPADLPWRGCQVRLVLSVRRFGCANQQCPRATFAEDLGPARQRTSEASAWLLALAQAVGGEAGSRLARAAGLPTSPDTLLRLLRRADEVTVPTPRVLGVDDLSLRRRRTYATLLVDLETHDAVDLLEGRDADTLATWLRQHPGIEIIVRDRAEAYAEGAAAGAPDAVQVADRFHLLQNASQALDEMLRNRRRRITISTPEPLPASPLTPEKPPSPWKQRMAERRAARVARWEEVHRRREASESLRQIAREMGMHRRTVRRLLESPIPPQNQITHPRPSGLSSPSLQAYVSYLQDRWQAGCHNVAQLYREIVAQGFGGSRSLLSQALRPWHPPRPPPRERRRTRRLSVRWLCLRPPNQLEPDEQSALERVLEEDAKLGRGHALLQQFREVIATRDVAGLHIWLGAAQDSDLPSFQSLANGIRADLAAVEAALTHSYSNGPVEGHVHKVKLIKRQGYGRASFTLLRRRVLAA